MKAQTRRGALTESGINILVGFGISFLLNMAVLPLFGMHPSMADLFSIGWIFTAASVVRSYILRRLFEAMRLRKAPPAFWPIIEEIAAERHRQINGEGYTLEHDDQHATGEIARGAAAYAFIGAIRDDWARHTWHEHALAIWPWHDKTFRPTNARRDLVKAAAMIVAEIGRIDRRERNRHIENAICTPKILIGDEGVQ